ncbi:hypothetical protein CPAV1605_983 [seawater metagenome]|uniref:Uncharacterized protein n=1 Tax=seawater metagenome TaxID=1561972 RepID=A0A5E8CIQ3_9ZZZZ
MEFKQKYFKYQEGSSLDTYFYKYLKYKKKYFSLKNQYGSSASKQTSFGKRIDGQIETVEWSKEDHMTKDTPVGTLFTIGSKPGEVFRIIKIVDGPVETETKTVNNNDGTVRAEVIAKKTVDRICAARISLSNGNILGIRCFFPQSLINSDYLNRHRKLGRFSFGINGDELAIKINTGEKLSSDERAWQMIYNSKMVNPDNQISSIKNINQFNNYVNRLNVEETEKAKIESQRYSGMINETSGIREDEILDAVKEMEKLPPR